MIAWTASFMVLHRQRFWEFQDEVVLDRGEQR